MYIRDDPHASYKLLGKELAKRGYSISEEELGDGHIYVTFVSPAGELWRTRASKLGYPYTTEEIRHISRNKEVAYKFAAKLDVSIPYTRYLLPDEKVTQTETEALLKTHAKLIVKPSDTSLSRGLTLNIDSFDALSQAVGDARQVAPTVLIQEQVEGEEIRFVIINGKVVAALLRQTARVTGDGKSTIAELVKQENQARSDLKFEYITYPQLDETMIAPSYFTDESIPAKGEVIELNRATMIKNGCSVYNVFPATHPSYITTVERLGAQLGARFIVIDVFVKDYTKPQTKHNYWFIEFNTSPVLKLFYGCRDGHMYDIVPKLVESIDEHLHPGVNHHRETIGSFEAVLLPDFTDTELTAKIDTGAYSGALYATHVRKKVDETGRPYISFYLWGDETLKRTSYEFYHRNVRSAHGHVQSRYVIRAKLKIKGKLYETDIGLSDRSNMKYPILIGRKFLRDYNMLVDVIVNEDMDYEKELLG